MTFLSFLVQSLPIGEEQGTENSEQGAKAFDDGKLAWYEVVLAILSLPIGLIDAIGIAILGVDCFICFDWF